MSRDGKRLSEYLDEGLGRAVASSGHWDRQLVWWAGGQWGNRPVMVRVVDGTPKCWNRSLLQDGIGASL